MQLQRQVGIQYFPGLDQLDNALARAYIEVPIEHREKIDLMQKLVHKIRSETSPPTGAQWDLIIFVLSAKIMPFISCKYCRTATWLHLGSGVRPHMLFEEGQYLKGTLLMMKLDALKYWWMMKAGYHRLLSPWFNRRIRRSS